MLGRAIRNGWDAPTLMDLAESFRGHSGLMIRPKEAAYRHAIEIGSLRIFDASSSHMTYWLMPMAPAIDN